MKGNPNGTELLLEPSEHQTVRHYKEALVRDGIPAASFEVGDLDAEYDRLRGLSVQFTRTPIDAGPVRMAILNDTCGNLIPLIQMIDRLERTRWRTRHPKNRRRS